MSPRALRLFLGVLSVGLGACASDLGAPAGSGASDKLSATDSKANPSSVKEGSPLAGAILELANENDADALESRVMLPTRSAEEIVKVRYGYDGLLSTDDDVRFASLAQLDAVPYVGPNSFAAFRTYAEQTKMDAPYTSECTAHNPCADPDKACAPDTFNGSYVQICVAINPTADARDAAGRFIAALRSGDESTLESFVHPIRGFFVLSTPVDSTVALHYVRYSDTLVTVRERGGFTCADTGGKLERGSLPGYSRADAGFYKKGCFVNDRLSPQSFLSSAGNLRGKLEPDPVDPILLGQALDIESALTAGAYSTGTATGFYFFEDLGRWYLGAVDLVDPWSV